MSSNFVKRFLHNILGSSMLYAHEVNDVQKFHEKV